MANDVFLIQQNNVCGVDQQVQLVNGHELRIELNGRRKPKKYRVNTLVLDDKSHWRLRFPWFSFLIIIAVIASLLPGSLIRFAPDEISQWAAYGIGAAIILFCLYRLWTRTALVKSFRSTYAKYPLAELARNKPSKEEFTTFVRHLEEYIKSYKEKHTLPEDKQLAGEMRTLRRLKEEKIMSKTAYENAKEKLFKLF